MNMNIKQHIVDYIDTNPPLSNGMMSKTQIYSILYHLEEVLNKNIEGDIVELGCHGGTTSLYIKKWLDDYKSDKQYHVYDSWEGLPAKQKEDATNQDLVQFEKGFCAVSKQYFIQSFQNKNLDLPHIHSGWFKDIPDSEYPEKICFAFFDGDFYSSIMDSFNKTWHKLVPGAIIIIDDCGWDALPGCEMAIKEFLSDKKEDYSLLGYPDGNYQFKTPFGGGKIIKL
jgi:O-methyltransferase